MFSTTPILPVAATQKGALDGFQSTCSCGLVMKSSLLSLLEQDVAAHVAWHQKRGQ